MTRPRCNVDGCNRQVAWNRELMGACSTEHQHELRRLMIEHGVPGGRFCYGDPDCDDIEPHFVVDGRSYCDTHAPLEELRAMIGRTPEWCAARLAS